MLLNSPEILQLESDFLFLFERTFFKGIKGRPATAYMKAVQVQFKSKTFLVQVDKIIDNIYRKTIRITNQRIKNTNSAIVTENNFSNNSWLTAGEIYNYRSTAAISKPLPITEEVVRQALFLAKEVTESIIWILKDEGIYLEHPDTLEKRVRDLWGGKKYRAVRFTRTFTAEVAVNTALYRYQQLDMDLQFYAKLDDKTSPQCRMLHGTIFKANSPEARKYRCPLHFYCRSDLIPVPITRALDPEMRLENRDFSRIMDQKFNLLDDRIDKNFVEKTFDSIKNFRDKYSIDQFILDEDVEARLLKLNLVVETEIPSKEKSPENTDLDYENIIE